jgi:hypothetical protein
MEKKQEDGLAQMVKRLMNGDFFTSKASVSSIVSGCYSSNQMIIFLILLVVSSNLQSEFMR